MTVKVGRLRKLFGPRELDVSELRLEGATLSHVTRRGMREVLTGADLTVGRGEVVVVQGSAQSGKSTLARVIEGKVEPDQGIVSVDGRLRPNGFVAAIANPPASDWATSLDALGYLTAAYADIGFPSEAAPRAARDTLEACGLEDLCDREPWDIAHLDRVCLAVCGALTSMPVWLVFDEPELKLDRDQIEALYEFVHEVCVQAHLGCVWLTRSSGLASLADRWLVLRHGHLVGLGETPRRRRRLC